MEPDDIPVQDLLGVGSEPAPGPEELRAIVTRASRKRWGTAAVAATLALGLGLGVGFATSEHSSPATQTATGPAATNGAGNGAGAPIPSAGSSNSGSGGGVMSSRAGSISSTPSRLGAAQLTKLFNRTAGGVTIRGFLVKFPDISGVPASCGIAGTHLQVEVSSLNMVGIVEGGLPVVDRTKPASAIWSDLVGTAEGAPTAVVTAATSPGVTEVSMSFAGGATDKMAPVSGWVALAAPVSRALTSAQTVGTLTERQANGTVVASQTVQIGVQPAAANTAQCRPILPCVRAQTGSGSGGTGASTNGTATPAIACAPLPCGRLPRLSSPPATGQGAAAAPVPSVTAVNPAGPGQAATGGGAGAFAFACAVQPPAASGSSSGSSATKP
jgi:hypothetical protein